MVAADAFLHPGPALAPPTASQQAGTRMTHFSRSSLGSAQLSRSPGPPRVSIPYPTRAASATTLRPSTAVVGQYARTGSPPAGPMRVHSTTAMAPPRIWSTGQEGNAAAAYKAAEARRPAAAVSSPYRNIEVTTPPPASAISAQAMDPSASACIPQMFCCPLTSQVMREPVATCDGQFFERAAIEEWLWLGRDWLRDGKHTSPVNGAELASPNLTPQPALQAAIQAYMAHPSVPPEVVRDYESNRKVGIGLVASLLAKSEDEQVLAHSRLAANGGSPQPLSEHEDKQSAFGHEPEVHTPGPPPAPATSPVGSTALPSESNGTARTAVHSAGHSSRGGATSSTCDCIIEDGMSAERAEEALASTLKLDGELIGSSTSLRSSEAPMDSWRFQQQAAREGSPRLHLRLRPHMPNDARRSTGQLSGEPRMSSHRSSSNAWTHGPASGSGARGSPSRKLPQGPSSRSPSPEVAKRQTPRKQRPGLRDPASDVAAAIDAVSAATRHYASASDVHSAAARQRREGSPTTSSRSIGGGSVRVPRPKSASRATSTSRSPSPGKAQDGDIGGKALPPYAAGGNMSSSRTSLTRSSTTGRAGFSTGLGRRSGVAVAELGRQTAGSSQGGGSRPSSAAKRRPTSASRSTTNGSQLPASASRPQTVQRAKAALTKEGERDRRSLPPSAFEDDFVDEEEEGRHGLGPLPFRDSMETPPVDATDEAGRTPLILAAGEGDLHTMQSLILRGADVDARDECRCTALMYCATYGHVDAVRCLIESHAEVEATSKDGWTPLITAAYNGHISVIDALLESGARIEAADEQGWTSLMHVAFNGDHRTLRCLLDHGADINALDSDGRTALVYAAFNGHQANVKSLLEQGEKEVSSGRSVNDAHDTALLFASIHGHTEVVRTLLEASRASPETRHAALKLAADHGHHAVVELLVRRSAAELKLGSSTMPHAS
eukprot:TRINITY_DN31687_c0_g2_i1.p1 TRINITY_DN31687_c0_g2~~TRINITY_DN31687_c0_g2_i1.p1  ORF type:complete len:949 (+),score=187.37 TRINITY_DN31687_c0_g2_i1:125-2971(+)